MSHLLTGSFQLMKSLNRSLILNIIREKGPISRAEIAKITKLTPPTVSNLVKELLESKLVIESDLGESQGGRKPTMLVINAKEFYIIGIDVGTETLKGVIADLNAHIVTKKAVPIPRPITNEGFIDLMKSCIRQLLEEGNIAYDKYIGIGIGMHGVVDVDTGTSLFAPNLQLRHIPLKEELEKEFNILVKVENDARAMALGESWFGNGYGADDIVCVNVGSGIGAGVILNGKLFHGEHFISGEVGHMTIDINGPKCTCGNYGCLQTFASGPAIAERAKREILLGKESLITEMVNGDLDLIDGKIVYEAAIKGDALSIEILSEAGRYLGIGLTNIIHTLNPKKIIIGGGVANANGYVLKSVKETIQKRCLTQSAKQTEILLSKLGADATAIGAVTLILQELFSTHGYMNEG
jgi:N-acetylglucosamine repressor